tara:strand:- start:329 stop:583 length:255 start_codon:yes stop_codon:yes gene_type:complete
MEIYFDTIKKKLTKNLEIEKIDIIDNSYLHKNHKSFSPEKFHLKIIIKSNFLKNISKILAHKKVMSVLKKDLNNKIHALEILII